MCQTKGLYLLLLSVILMGLLNAILAIRAMLKFLEHPVKNSTNYNGIIEVFHDGVIVVKVKLSKQI